MKALLLAAGRSTRLYPLTRHRPKCLLPMGDRLLIDFLFSALDAAGVQEKIVVTGFHREQIEQHLDSRAKFIHSPDYALTNNLASLRAALDAGIEGPLLCLHADLLLHPAILQRTVETPGAVVLTVDRELTPETMKVSASAAKSFAVGKTLSKSELIGTFLGVAKLEAAVIQEVRKTLALLKEEEYRTSYFTAALRPWLEAGSVHFAWTDGLPWIEIDNAEDLERANREVLPRVR